VYAPAGDAAYATPNGEIVHVPEDFAFADTVVARDEELPAPSRPPQSIPAPPSRPPHSRPPRSYREQREQHTRQHELAELHAQQQLQMQQMQMQQMQQMQAYAPASQGPISRPPPSYPAGSDPGLVTSVRGAFQRAKFTIDSSRGEMKELWSATETSDHAMNGDEKDPLVRLARRVRTFWGFFEWDKDDVARAAWIGLAVFVIVVCAAFVVR
jgi:hypothetical protein